MDGLNPVEYLATKRLGSLKWLCEPAPSSAPLSKPVSPSPALHVLQCVCCEAQASIFEHVAHFLTFEELSSLASVSRRLGGLAPMPSGEVGDAHRRCWSGPLVPPFGLTTCANDETRTGKACHHKTRARYIHQPLRTESNGHALYWLDLERPQRILARGAREESAEGGNGNALATESGNGHSSIVSSMTGSNAHISGMGNDRPFSSKQRLGGGKEEGEATEQRSDHQAQAHARLKRRAVTLAASLAGGGVMIVFVVWQQSVTKSSAHDNGTPLVLALYLLLALACLGVGLWMWQMHSDRQRQSAMMPTASLTRRTRGKRRNQQQMGNLAGNRAARDEEAQDLLGGGSTDYGSGREGP